MKNNESALKREAQEMKSNEFVLKRAFKDAESAQLALKALKPETRSRHEKSSKIAIDTNKNILTIKFNTFGRNAKASAQNYGSLVDFIQNIIGGN